MPHAKSIPRRCDVGSLSEHHHWEENEGRRQFRTARAVWFLVVVKIADNWRFPGSTRPLVAFIPMPTVAFAIVRLTGLTMHVTLTPGATALAVATDTLWVPFGHKANLAPQHWMGGLRRSSMSR